MTRLFCIFILSLNLTTLFATNFSESCNAPWGVDCDFVEPNSVTSKPKLSKGQKVCESMIHFFQNTISPIDGPRSSFYPTSSQYALDAIRKYGVFKGIALGCDRLMRENRDWWIYETTPDYGFDRKVDPVR